jgi:hypothetical protein
MPRLRLLIAALVCSGRAALLLPAMDLGPFAPGLPLAPRAIGMELVR